MKNRSSLKIRNRQYLEAAEKSSLALYAKASEGSHATRRFEEPEHPYRTAFQRDRDRILHSRAFRRLKHKRQVFLTSESDHYRTRITHTLEVAQLSRTMARALGLNEDLVEAIALGHDLGHTPFGHLGEVILNQVMSGEKTIVGQEPTQNFGGFKHNYQSVRIVDHLEKKYTFDGLNLTAPVREGILKHTRLRRGRFVFPDFHYDGLRFEHDAASTLEGQVVAICDEIAQRTHDLEDGMRAGLVDVQKVRRLQIAKLVHGRVGLDDLEDTEPILYRDLLIRGLINYLVDDVIQNTLKNIKRFVDSEGRLYGFDEEIVGFGAKADPLQKQLNKFIYKEIIDFSRDDWSDELGEKLLFRLFEAYFLEPDLLPDYVLSRYFHKGHDSFTSTSSAIPAGRLDQIQKDAAFSRIICDHIAGMTDHFAVQEAKRLARLNKFEADDLRLELALGKTSHGTQ